MKLWAGTILLALCLWGGSIESALAFQGRAYMTVQEYVQVHPEQKALMERFSALVQKDGSPSTNALARKPVTIAFVYPGEQVSDYWRRSIDSFKGRMDQIGIQYTLHQYFSKPVEDYRIQEQQIKTAIQHDPDYLVFTLDAQKHRRVIERLLTRGRPKIILQNITTPLRAWEGKQPFLYVGFDHATGTEILARHYVEETGGQGDFAMLFFSQGYVSEMRGNTFVDYMKSHSKMVLKESYYTDGNKEKARLATLEILNKWDVSFLYACSTDIALGAVDALAETGKTGEVLVNGWGGGSNELAAISKGDLDFTVMRMNDDNGVAMAEAIRLDLEGRPREVPTVFSGEFVLVKKGISQEKLQQLEEKAFRYSSIK
ncbi:MAG: autoinducer 2-binding periplasmic protein LuxP [Desulfatibacillum sp.]|nr:autoinducer 2-binding periplasmic protein LuxP [Desulfatibacillum sp.]